jgi:hypothetical protein
MELRMDMEKNRRVDKFIYLINNININQMLNQMDYYEKQITKILQREKLKEEIKNTIFSYKLKENIKKNIFIYGDCGIGKSFFISNIINEINYDMLLCDNTERNKTYIENIVNGNISNQNVINMFHNIKKQIIILIDDIDTVNDKNVLSMIIKMVRPKKTKKQKLEGSSINQIICIANTIEDKKIKELANVCFTFELLPPTKNQMFEIIQLLMPDIDLYKAQNNVGINLKRLKILYDIYLKDKTIITSNFFTLKTNYTYDEAKECTKNIINKQNKEFVFSEPDRNIIGLLWHENIIDVIDPKDQQLYIQFMENICFADYIDKFIFQKQIWQLNEMTFIIKVFKNMILFKGSKINDIRFTKILTKYSTEYNNYMFIRELCISLTLDVKDMYQYFLHLRENSSMEEIAIILGQYDISLLSINRIYKFIDRLTE